MSAKKAFFTQYGSADHVKHILKNMDAYVRGDALRSALLSNPHIDQEIVDMAYKHPHSRILAASHPKLSSEMHDHALKFDNVDVQEAALVNPKTKLHHSEERAKNSQYSYIRELAQEQIDDWRKQHKGD
jgi:hypothetical protein